MSKEITAEEARQVFLDHIRHVVGYWASLPDLSDIDKCNGVAFSILTLIDGCNSMPAMDVVMRPHPVDLDYAIINDEDYFVDGLVINGDCMLHDLFYP